MSTPETAEDAAELSQPLCVLIVDNDQPHADAISESLSRVGYDCTVSDGPTALTLIDENIYDLIRLSSAACRLSWSIRTCARSDSR